MEVKRDFKGIWIPKEIWLIKRLKPVYRVFLAEIDSLDDGRGCWAKNQHFAELFGLSRNRCSEIILMLEKKGYISIDFEPVQEGDPVRKIRLIIPVEKSTDLSKSRSKLSKSRLTLSRNRQVPYKELEIHLETRERETRALEFLKINFPSRYEQEFQMQYESKIRDMKKFSMDFDDTVTMEKLDFDKALFGRLGKYARNWIQNQDKYSPVDDTPGQKLTRLVD